MTSLFRKIRRCEGSDISARPNHDGPLKVFQVSTHSIQGRRPHQEDRFVCVNLKTHANLSSSIFQQSCRRLNLFVVCDGHAGGKCSTFIVDNIVSTFWEIVLELGKSVAVPIVEMTILMKEILSRLPVQLDDAYLRRACSTKERDGSCLLASILLDDRLYTTNVGDCRLVLVNKAGKSRQVTHDHRPGLSKEEDSRILASGALIELCRGAEQRVCAKGLRMAISRALGDRLLKPNIISSVPDVFQSDLADVRFVCLISDGVTCRVSNTKFGAILRNADPGFLRLNRGEKVNFAKSLVDHAFAKGSMDNITACVLYLE